MSHQRTELNIYKYQELMDELVNMMVRMKVHLYPENYEKLNLKKISKPTIEEVDRLTIKIHLILSKNSETLKKDQNFL